MPLRVKTSVTSNRVRSIDKSCLCVRWQALRREHKLDQAVRIHAVHRREELTCGAGYDPHLTIAITMRKVCADHVEGDWNCRRSVRVNWDL